MQFALKLLITNIIILLCVWLGKRHPSLGGLIATMPITSLLVLMWLYHSNPADRTLQTGYVSGVFFGVIPTMLFFGAAWICLKRGFPLPSTLLASFTVWFAAALIHQLVLK
jgi:F0F1-type ATP synthase assembly protein I